MDYFNIPNLLCDYIPGVGAYEYRDYENLMSAPRVGTFLT